MGCFTVYDILIGNPCEIYNYDNNDNDDDFSNKDSDNKSNNDFDYKFAGSIGNTKSYGCFSGRMI